MKPIVLLVKETDGKIIMDANAMNELIDRVYEVGKQDGMTIISQPITVNPTWNPFKNGKPEITCEVTE